MSTANLLQKFIREEVPSNSQLLPIYNYIRTATHTFEELIRKINEVSDLTLDFEFLRSEAKLLNTQRIEIQKLLTTFTEMIGSNIEELCNRDLIFTAPTKLDGCPFSSEALVLYTNRPLNEGVKIQHDGDYYRITAKKLEDTGYYKIWCYSIEVI